jgi:collagenase-like PrtC family protease
MSHTCQTLMQELLELAAAGVSRIRLSPQDCDMVAVAEIYDDAIAGRRTIGESLARLESVYPGIPFSNGFHHGQTGAAWVKVPISAEFPVA